MPQERSVYMNEHSVLSSIAGDKKDNLPLNLYIKLKHSHTENYLEEMEKVIMTASRIMFYRIRVDFCI